MSASAGRWTCIVTHEVAPARRSRTRGRGAVLAKASNPRDEDHGEGDHSCRRRATRRRGSVVVAGVRESVGGGVIPLSIGRTPPVGESVTTAMMKPPLLSSSVAQVVAPR